MTSGGIDWQREKWRDGFGSKFIRQGEKNAVKYADEIIFSMQSLLPLIAVTFIYDSFFSNHKVAKSEGIVYVVFLLISILALVTNMFVSPSYLTTQSYVRIIYQAVIIYFYYSMTHVKYLLADIYNAIYSLIGVGCMPKRWPCLQDFFTVGTAVAG